MKPRAKPLSLGRDASLDEARSSEPSWAQLFFSAGIGGGCALLLVVVAVWAAPQARAILLEHNRPVPFVLTGWHWLLALLGLASLLVHGALLLRWQPLHQGTVKRLLPLNIAVALAFGFLVFSLLRPLQALMSSHAG